MGGGNNMQKIIISCDTTACIKHNEANKLGVYVLPLNVIVDNKEYHDGVDIDNDMLCTMMRNKATIKTSTPTPLEIETFFNNIIEKENPDRIIHFTISSKLSSMFELFTNFCQTNYGDKVTVIDSLSVCSFMGNIVRYAVRLKDEGKDADTIVELSKKRVGTEIVRFVPETMVYLKRGGRVSPAVAMIGNLLGIKPVLKLGVNGIEKESTTRTIKKAYMKTLEEYSKKPDLDKYEIHIVEFDSMPTCKKIAKAAKEMMPNIPILITPMSINVCAHAGPGTFGIGLVLKVND